MTEIASKIVLNVENNTWKIVNKDDKINDINEVSIEINSDKLTFSRVYGPDTCDIMITTPDEFKADLTKYATEFSYSPEEIEAIEKSWHYFELSGINGEKYKVNSTSYSLDSDLCSFELCQVERL